MSVDWSKMSPIEIWEALQAVPPILGSWEESEDDAGVYKEVHKRWTLHEPLAEVHRNLDAPFLWTWIDHAGGVDGQAPTLAEAKAACDESLRSSGWLLVGD